MGENTNTLIVLSKGTDAGKGQTCFHTENKNKFSMGNKISCVAKHYCFSNTQNKMAEIWKLEYFESTDHRQLCRHKYKYMKSEVPNTLP
jgi:hypothetical protein